MTVWNEKAQHWDIPKLTVVAVKGVKVSDFNNRSLSTVSTSSIEANPDIPEAHQLREWLSSQHGDVPTHPLSVSGRAPGAPGGDGGFAGGRTDPKRTLSEIKEANLGRGPEPDYFVCRATISLFKKEGVMWYNACPTKGCNKKVTQQGGMWRCDKCNASTPERDVRYILSMLVTDHTSNQWLSSFDDVGAQILKHPAQELSNWKENQQDHLVEQVFSNSLFQTFNFKIRAKEETYNSEPRVKCSIISATQVAWAQEGRAMVEEIKKYGSMVA